MKKLIIPTIFLIAFLVFQFDSNISNAQFETTPEKIWAKNGPDTSLLIDADGDTTIIIYDDDAGSVVWKVGTEDQTLKILTDTMEVINVISLIPVSTIAGIEWDGLNIDGSALDPSAVDAEIHGVHIDLSGVSTTNNPEIQGLNIKVPRPTDHALHMNSSVLVELDATSFASGMNASVLDATIDVTGSTGGSVHIVEANVLGHEAGTASGAVVTSYGDFPLLHQHAGVFLTPVQAGASSECGEWDSSGTNYVAGLDGVTVFDADNDGIFIGDADDKFDAVEIIYSANATKNIVARFFYATSPSAWTEFFPTDGTDGGQVDGVITFDPAGLAGWADTDIGQDVGEHDECYWVKIIRTRNGTVGTPTISVAKTLTPTEYLWDGDGNITANTVSSNLSIINGNVGVGINSPSSALHIKANVSGVIGSHDAGQLIIQNPTNSVFSNAVITGYESDASGNPDQQLWYLGGSSGSNSEITFLNRRNSKLNLGTNGASRLTINGGGNVGIGILSPPERLSVVGNIATGDTTTGDVDVSHYFSTDGSWTNEYLKWDDGNSRFELSDDIEVTGLSIGGKAVTGNGHFTFTIFNPGAIYAADHEVCICLRTEAALTITRFDVTCDADPGTELEYSLKYADAFIGFANAVVIDDTATVAGVTTVTGGFGDNTVPANKCIYLLLDSDPDDAITQIAFDIMWDFD